MKRIYVGNLDAQITAGDIQVLFEQYGKVNRAGIICDPETGRSRGFAFVLMGNDREGEEAIQNLNQRSLAGRRLDVKEALPPEADPKYRERAHKRE
jgi:cold-inducible RNA-binding protein